MFPARAFLISLVSLCAFSATPSFLLPDDVVPIKHTVELRIDPSRGSFEGNARIEIELKKQQTEIWLNGKDLAISRASIDFSESTYKARAKAIGGEFIRLTTDQAVGPGRAVISIRYRAPLSAKDVSGPFRKKVAGRWYAFTVFTPIEARRAFPCFDEPRFKTPWELSIQVRRTEKAFANAPEVSETEQANGFKLVHFAVTRPLAAEVVAFAVGPFDVWDGERAGAKQTPVRVVTPRGQGADGKDAVIATTEILPRLEKYTGIAYPWEKLDHVALPAAAFGAVENPGLITYRSRSLLLAPGEEDPERIVALHSVEAHEIGHQWFGNLVTQASWEDVWLSEGFATWFAAKIIDQELPDDSRHLAAIAARERIMAADSGPESRPVRLAMHSRADMKSVYSRIVYQKGAAVLLMLENWLGEDQFQKALQSYLRAHALSNATTADLASALMSATHIDPTSVMHSFLDQPGIPSVRAELDCESGIAPRIRFEQTGPGARWTIPVCWRADGIDQTCTVLDSSRRETALQQASACPGWIFANAGGAGYYRTLWTAPQLAAIAKNIDRLSPAERLTLAYDIAALLKAGTLTREDTEPVFKQMLADPEPQIAREARIALGLEIEHEPARQR